MNTKEYFVFEGLPDEAFKEIGREVRQLECVACGDLWCKHIKLAMTTNADHEFVWIGSDTWTSELIHIPMFPTQNLWAVARLEMTEAGYAKLYQTSEDTGNEIQISYLHPGEGRQVIRTTFVDHMQGHRLVADNGQCQSPSHKFKQEQLWQQRTRPDNANRLVEFWCVWQYGVCTACRSGNTTGFDEDLVPDDDRQRPW